MSSNGDPVGDVPARHWIFLSEGETAPVRPVPVFTPEQEAELREIVRAEIAGAIERQPEGAVAMQVWLAEPATTRQAA